MGGVGWVWGTGSYTVRQNLHSCVILVMVGGMGKGGEGKAYISKLTYYVDEKKNDRIGDGKGGEVREEAVREEICAQK